MSVVVVLVPFLLAVLVVPVVLLLLAATSRPDSALLPATAAARRHAVVGGSLAVVVGLAVFLPALYLGTDSDAGSPSDQLLTAAPALAVLAHTAVLALTEVTWPRPTGAVRRVRLQARTVHDTSPALMRRSLHLAVAATAATAVAGALLADETQRSLSVVESRYPDGSVMVGSSTGPFPGLYYGVPALLGVLAVLVAAELTLRLVVNRPAVAGADEATDTALRRASAHRVLRGTLAGVLLTLGPVLAIGGMMSTNVTTGTFQGVAVAVAAVGGLAGLAGLVVALVPAPRVPAPTPVSVPQQA